MNFELYIENLGAIEKAEITINPLTILAGENGTGKSFVTKFLYSVLNVLMRDVYKQELISILNELKYNNDILKSVLDNDTFNNMDNFLLYMKNCIYNNMGNLNYNSHDTKDILYRYYDEIKIFKNNVLDGVSTKSPNIRVISESDSDSYNVIQSGIIDKNIILIPRLYDLIKEPKIGYFYVLEKNITSELKRNFQISNINQLVKKGKEKTFFKIKDIVEIEIVGDDLSVKNFQITNNLSEINRLVFFESPIYWRLSMELIENSSRPKNYYLSDKISDERLTGVPKYFLDLRELLFSRFEKGEKEPFVEQCANDLQKSLNGKFNTESYDLSFETNQGQTINKTLVSFGMTNLGILQAILNKNIIHKGSFVFIDEPESNLHPEWQAVLADILVKLAENGMFVVITTHSSDMLKALDVISQERKNTENFVSVNYFEKGGNLLPLNNNDSSTIQQARLKLLETYDEMVLRGYLL